MFSVDDLAGRDFAVALDQPPLAWLLGEAWASAELRRMGSPLVIGCARFVLRARCAARSDAGRRSLIATDMSRSQEIRPYNSQSVIRLKVAAGVRPARDFAGSSDIDTLVAEDGAVGGSLLHRRNCPPA